MYDEVSERREDLEYSIWRWEMRRLDRGGNLKPKDAERLKFLKTFKEADLPKPPTWR